LSLIVGSQAILSAAGHMLTDVVAKAGSLLAIRLAARPTSVRWTFGFKRAEILSAAVEGITLAVISAIVAVEAIRRLIDPPPAEGGPVLFVALLGVAVRLVAVWVLAKANRTSLNVEG
jgi:cobalt-zinc-cadmium efflux system protein